MEEAEALCDRVAIVDGGQVVALDSPRALTAQLGGDIRVSFTAGDADVAFLHTVPGVTSVALDERFATVSGSAPIAVGVAAALAERGMAPADYRTHYPTLEDVFLAQTGRSLLNGA